MVLEHIAAVLLFSGPFFYLGLWMAIAPASVARVPERIFGLFGRTARSAGGLTSGELIQPNTIPVSRRLRTGLRIIGVALVLISIMG